MVRRNRRRTLIGLGSVVFGASGFVASGAFSFGSEGSLGDSFVQVEGTNQAVEFNTPQLTDEAAVSEGGEGSGSEGDDSGGSDESADGTTGSDENTDEEQTQEDPQEDTGGGGDGGGGGGQTPSTRVQVVTDPNNSGNAVNTGGSASWNGKIIASEAIHETADGFFGGITAENMNSNALFTVGELQGKYPGEQVAFIIANVGPAGNQAQSAPVDIIASQFADGQVVNTDQLRFSYKVVDNTGTTTARGENLFSAGSVRLAEGDIIETVVVIDTRSGDNDLKNLDTIRFTATGANN